MALVAAVVAAASGCGSDPACHVGSEGCACTGGGACDLGLVCDGTLCVRPVQDTGTDLDALADTLPDADALGEADVEASQCSSDGDCDDGDPCTADTCEADWGECAHGPRDADGDGYVAASVEGTACAGGTDCLDDVATAFPGAAIVECSDLDNDCNGNADVDDDGDGHEDVDCGGDDCRDDDAATIEGDCIGVNECCDGCSKLNGCWPDAASGLMWEDPPGATWSMYHEEAAPYCASLSLAGHGPGEWRLPTISELRTLVRGCPASEPGGACGVTDGCLLSTCRVDCGGCTWVEGSCYWPPGIEGSCSPYWSSSPDASNDGYYWALSFTEAIVYSDSITNIAEVRCVRPGP